MVHHIVMWKFKPEIEEERKADLKKRYGSESEQSDWKGTGTFKCIVCK